MRRALLPAGLALVLLAGCRGDRMSVLDQELLVYKVQHERQRREDLEKEYAEEQKRCDDLTARILDLRRAHDDGIADLHAAQEQAAAVAGELAALRTQEAADRKTVGEIEALRQRAATLLGQREALQKQIAERTAALAADRPKAEALAKEKADLDARIAALRKEVEALGGEKARLEGEPAGEPAGGGKEGAPAKEPAGGGKEAVPAGGGQGPAPTGEDPEPGGADGGKPPPKEPGGGG